MFLPAALLLPILAWCTALGLGVLADTSRNALPPSPPRFVRPAHALLADDFAGGRLGAAWRADRGGVWTLTRGMLRAELPDERQAHSMLYAGDSTWTDYAVDADVCGMRGVDKGLAVRVRGSRGLGVDLRGPGYQDLRIAIGEQPIGRADVDNANGTWHHVRVEMRGSRATVRVDGEVRFDRRVSSRIPGSGGIALAAYTGGVGECTVFYDNVVVTPLDGR